MARKKRINDGVVSSIYVERELKTIADLCKVSDSDLWTRGLKSTLEAVDTPTAWKHLLKIYEFEEKNLQEKMQKIRDKIGEVYEMIYVRDNGDDRVYQIREVDFDPKTQRRV